MSEEYVASMQDDMKGAIEALRKTMSSVRTGRASPALLTNLHVEVASYGASMPLNQLATVTAPDARLLVISPWDKTTILDIERAIATSQLGLNPGSDGQIIRVPIPALTGDRRKDLTRVVRKYGEEHKVRVRNVRREYKDLFKELESAKEISEDELERHLKTVQTTTDEYIKLIDTVVAAKEKEILEV